MLENQKIKKNHIHKFRQSYASVSKHPYFGIVLTGFILIMIQVFGLMGLVNASTVSLLTPAIIYFIVGLGYTLLLGYAGLASLGTAGFIGLGTYIIAHMSGNLGLPTEFAVLAGIVIAILLGLVVGFISLRIEGMYLAIITLGISEILVEIFKKNVAITHGNAGYNFFKLSFLGLESKLTNSFFLAYYLIVIVMVLVMIWTINLIKSPTGRAMLAMKNSTSAAQAMGISVLKYRLLAFVIATVIAVFGGMLYMLRFLNTQPGSWGIALSLNILAAVVIGGTKSMYGVMAGTFIIFALNDIVLKRMAFFQEFPNASYILNGLLIILVVMFYPGGIVRLFTDIKNGFIKLYKKIKSGWRDYRYGKDTNNVQ